MYNIIPVNGRLFAVNTTTQSYFVHVVLDSIVSKEEIMRELCQAVVCVEREGAIVTSVHEVTADGRRPRVAYRQSQEYKLARKEPEQHIASAMFVSHWASGATFRSPCQVDMNTHEVFEIQNAGCPGDDDNCLSESVEYEGDEKEVYSIDESCGLDAFEAFGELTEIAFKVHEGACWRSEEGRILKEELEKVTRQYQEGLYNNEEDYQ